MSSYWFNPCKSDHKRFKHMKLQIVHRSGIKHFICLNLEEKTRKNLLYE